MFKRWMLSVVLLCLGTLGFGQVADGKLQIHHIDVGQGDGAVLVSPGGQVVLFDMGEDLRTKSCQGAIDYLDQMGVKQIDYIFISHYHFDHIGCIPAVLKEFPLAHFAYDRGESYPGATFTAYKKALGKKRKTATVGQDLVLDQGSAHPVTLHVLALDGQTKETQVKTANENDLSVTVLVEFGGFREEIGGDLSGDNTDMYEDIETPVAKDVGEIDVYKVHHHCSSHSTNYTWLQATRPTIAVISTGDGNDYGHPTAECLTRLHEADLQKIYWTEVGAGQKPVAGIDVVSGDLTIEVPPEAKTYQVSYKGATPATYTVKAAAAPDKNDDDNNTPVQVPKYAWSVKSSYYHEANCPAVKRISSANLQTGDTPPADKKPSSCVKGGS